MNYDSEVQRYKSSKVLLKPLYNKHIVPYPNESRVEIPFLHLSPTFEKKNSNKINKTDNSSKDTSVNVSLKYSKNLLDDQNDFNIQNLLNNEILNANSGSQTNQILIDQTNYSIESPETKWIRKIFSENPLINIESFLQIEKNLKLIDECIKYLQANNFLDNIQFFEEKKELNLQFKDLVLRGKNINVETFQFNPDLLFGNSHKYRFDSKNH